MDKTRIGSAAIALWALLQAYFLLTIGYTPDFSPMGWSIAVGASALSIAVWLRRRWARLLAVSLAAILFCGYVFIIIFTGFVPCSGGDVTCIMQVASQPLITGVVVAVLVRP
jgi:hypothetical protein